MKVEVNTETKIKLVKNFFDNTSAYLKNNVVIRLRKLILKNSLEEIKNIQVLDLGCGDGFLLA